MQPEQFDAVILGGGFYGCCIAQFLHERGLRPVIVERDSDLLLRASYANQARVHHGYHYPRSFITAWRSSINFPRFVQDFRECIDDRFEKVYAIARQNSKVSAYQFRQFCSNIGAPVRSAPRSIQTLFNPRLIEEAFIVKEFAFDAAKLRAIIRGQLEQSRIPVLLNTEGVSVQQETDESLIVTLANGDMLRSRYVFCCTYARLNTVLQSSGLPLLPLKHELTELALVRVPSELESLGITVMDGPFFSVMPFPAEGLHSLSHVRYTPHDSWIDLQDGSRDPYTYMNDQRMTSHFLYMLRDSERYLPGLKKVEYARSLFEVKTVLLKNERDDGRPILYQEHYGLKNFFVIMGGKIDNIYDILATMRFGKLAVKEVDVP